MRHTGLCLIKLCPEPRFTFDREEAKSLNDDLFKFFELKKSQNSINLPTTLKVVQSIRSQIMFEQWVKVMIHLRCGEKFRPPKCVMEQ